MTYKCSICEAPSKPRQARRTWPLKRADGSILKGLSVCGDCLWLLQCGTPYPEVQRQRGKPPVEVVLPPEPEPEPLEPAPVVRPKAKPAKRVTDIESLRRVQKPL